MTVALSTGCFIHHEAKLANCHVECFEVSSHRPQDVPYFVTTISNIGGHVVSIHSPCPNRGSVINLAAEGMTWTSGLVALKETLEIARYCSAKYVVVHAFYCLPGELPCNDIERMTALRLLDNNSFHTVADYLASDLYEDAKQRAIANLKSILPRLRREFPGQRIVLENLNPRLGYGGIRIKDVIDIVAVFGGDLGICIDFGHLQLARAVLGDHSEDGIDAARDFVCATHLHQNFGGEYFVDRFWDESKPRFGLQEFDVHSPFGVRFRRNGDSDLTVLPENKPFGHLLKGSVQYSPIAGLDSVAGQVDLGRVLEAVPESTSHVLELDSRYVPLEAILSDYDVARNGIDRLAALKE